MPDPKAFNSEQEFMTECIKTAKAEGKSQDQAVAMCAAMWQNRGDAMSNPEPETRILREPVELREGGEGERPTIEGRAVVYGAWSHDLGGFRERFLPGAFGNLAEADVLASLNHDMRAQLLGRTPDTLELKDSKAALRYRIKPPDTQAARDAIELIRSGIVPGSSFTFRVKAGGEKIEEGKDGKVTRTISDAQLFEVAPVASPAYPQTDTAVAQRSIDAYRKAKSAAEEARARAAEADLKLREREALL